MLTPGAAILPHREDLQEQLDWLAQEIEELGGDAWVLPVTELSEVEERKVRDQMRAVEFVPRTRDVSGAGGIPFDLRGAELSHRRGCCTLEALIDKYEIADEALRRMARIVPAADLPQDDPVPAVAPGVLAIFDGIRDGCETDEERLDKGFVVCDALYAYCRQTREAAWEL